MKSAPKRSLTYGNFLAVALLAVLRLAGVTSAMIAGEVDSGPGYQGDQPVTRAHIVNGYRIQKSIAR